MGLLSGIGLLAILIGFVLWYFGSRERGEMDIDLGFFKGPVYFLLIVLGLFLMIADVGLPYLY